jgi:phage-related tail fiber protein
MSNTYGTIITTKGAAIIADCIVNGGQLVISEAAAGDGNGAYYQPTVNQEHLVHECWRGEIAAAELNPSTPNMLDVKIVIGDEVGGFTIREMGLFSEDGTLIAVCNTPDTEKVAISGGVSGKLTMVMHIIVADISVVEFTINPSLDTVSQEELMGW